MHAPRRSTRAGSACVARAAAHAQVYVPLVIVGGRGRSVAWLPAHVSANRSFRSLLLRLPASRRRGRSQLPLSLSSGSTLSVSYAADLMALLLLGPRHARGRRGGRRVDAVHVQGQAAVSGLSHRLQHGGRGDHDGGHRVRLPVARRLAGAARRRQRSPSRWSARSPRISSSTPVWSPARSRCRRAGRGGRSGTTSSCGARPVSWSRAAPARWPRWSSIAANTGRRCC